MVFPFVAIVALIASKRSFLGVSEQLMSAQVMFVASFVVTLGAHVCSTTMHNHMFIERLFSTVPLVTMLACKWSLLGMSA